jgi:hypothetical protein
MPYMVTEVLHMNPRLIKYDTPSHVRQKIHRGAVTYMLLAKHLPWVGQTCHGTTGHCLGG